MCHWFLPSRTNAGNLTRMFRQGRGYSLIETIFACFILSAIVLALFELFPGSLLTMRRASKTIEAGNVAEAALDKLRSAGYSIDMEA